ncbi:manganese efflux pump [Kyrpidia sp.]|uniref:manganese efflux pump MntP n=1 Tax=Kyrpidia sp. TaxID=2073077 RepID=UPI002590043B|nr:manganese efflux pump [Kyrpidia sp.]MCL6576834.1 manganese efflux pump MntP family protein [Kyrpidia sp.]
MLEEVLISPAIVYSETALMSVALATDVFAVSLKLGLQGVSRHEREGFELAVTLFHIVLPALGLELGRRLHGRFGDLILPVGMIVFFLLGVHTISQAWRHRNERWSLSGPVVVLAAAASIDAFTAAMALSFTGVLAWVVIPIVGLTAWGAARAGFALGYKAGSRWGWRAELIGGGLLIAMGLYMLTGLA